MFCNYSWLRHSLRLGFSVTLQKETQILLAVFVRRVDTCPRHHHNFPTTYTQRCCAVAECLRCSLRTFRALTRAGARFEPDHGHRPCHGTHKVESACYLQWDGELCTGFGWGYGGNVASVGWQVKLCDPIRL